MNKLVSGTIAVALGLGLIGGGMSIGESNTVKQYENNYTHYTEVLSQLTSPDGSAPDCKTIGVGPKFQLYADKTFVCFEGGSIALVPHLKVK